MNLLMCVLLSMLYKRQIDREREEIRLCLHWCLLQFADDDLPWTSSFGACPAAAGAGLLGGQVAKALFLVVNAQELFSHCFVANCRASLRRKSNIKTPAIASLHHWGATAWGAWGGPRRRALGELLVLVWQSGSECEYKRKRTTDVWCVL